MLVLKQEGHHLPHFDRASAPTQLEDGFQFTPPSPGLLENIAPALGPTPRGQPGVLRVHWDNPGSISRLVPQPQILAKTGQWDQEPFFLWTS